MGGPLVSDRCYMRCRSRDGTPKKKYRSLDEAVVTGFERGWEIDVYPCPWKRGQYHITHKRGETN
jgi:hypothetical protein